MALRSAGHRDEVTAVVGATILVATAVGVVYWLRGQGESTPSLSCEATAA